MTWQMPDPLENDGPANTICGLDNDRNAYCWNAITNMSAPYRLRDQPRLVSGSNNGFVFAIDESGRLWQWEAPGSSLLIDGPTLIVLPP
jgi:hypothetical protein